MTAPPCTGRRIWTPRTTVAAIVEDAGRFLMVEEMDESGRRVINQPAGHLEDGESLEAAVKREVLEESGWEIGTDALVGIYKWRVPESSKTYVRYCYSARVHNQRHLSPPDSDILAAHWLTAHEIHQAGDRHRSPMVALCLADYLKGQRHPLDTIHELV